MRRVILAILGAVLFASFSSPRAEAQVFRRLRPTSPAAIRPRMGPAFNPFVGRSFAAFRPPALAFGRINAFPPRIVPTFQTPRGTFAPAFPGSFNPRTGAFTPTLTGGASTLISRGVFMPTSGTFVPTPFGNLALATRNTFNPFTGRFVQSPTGPFVFATTGNLISSQTNNRVPVQFRGIGRLNPLNPFNPVNQANALALYQARLNTILSGNPYGIPTYGINPYSPVAAGYGAGYANPYAYGDYGGGYGGGYGSPYGYGGGIYGGSSYASAASSIPQYAAQQAPAQQDTVLAAYGLPNAGGQVQWPLAFRLMPPDEKRDLLDKFESQMKVVSEQGAAGKVSPVVLNEARRSLEGLQSWLKSRRLEFAEATYRDADAMLQSLGKTLRTMSY